MKWIVLISVALILNFSPPPPAFAGESFSQVIYRDCFDGDSCYFRIPDLPDLFGGNVFIHLRGVNAPELRGPTVEAARAARSRLRDLLSGAARINLISVERRGQALIGVACADGVNISALMVDEGLGERTDGPPSPCPVNIPPWVWRAGAFAVAGFGLGVLAIWGVRRLRWRREATRLLSSVTISLPEPSTGKGTTADAPGTFQAYMENARDQLNVQQSSGVSGVVLQSPSPAWAEALARSLAHLGYLTRIRHNGASMVIVTWRLE